MASNEDISDSDSDSLPDVTEIFPAPSNEILKGGIVWAKFKKLYWPALVRHVYQKEKKVTVWYTDDPGKNFKLSMKNVFCFHDPIMTAKIKNEIREHHAELIYAHDGLTNHALSYLNRKVQGLNDDPLKFFDQTYPYFLMEEYMAKNPTVNKDALPDMKISPLYLSHGTKSRTSAVNKLAVNKRASTSEADISEDDSDIVSASDESDEDLPIDKAKSADKAISNSSENEYINELVTCITSGKADTYISDVISKKISSFYYKFYLNAMKSDIKLLDSISYGPIEDLVKLREIIFHLLALYKQISSKGQKRKFKPSVTYSSSGNKIEDSRFVSSVLLPESIIYAISYVNKVSIDKAKVLFHQNHESLKMPTKSNGTDSTKRVMCSVDQTQDNLKYDIDVAGSSNKKLCLVLTDVLKDIDNGKYPKDSVAASSEIKVKKADEKTPQRKSQRLNRTL